MIYLLDNNVLQYFFHARRELALRHWSGRRPTWWPTWRASVEPMDAIDR